MTSLDQAMLELTETALKVKEQRDIFKSALELIEAGTVGDEAIAIAYDALQKARGA